MSPCLYPLYMLQDIARALTQGENLVGCACCARFACGWHRYAMTVGEEAVLVALVQAAKTSLSRGEDAGGADEVCACPWDRGLGAAVRLSVGHRFYGTLAEAPPSSHNNRHAHTNRYTGDPRVGAVGHVELPPAHPAALQGGPGGGGAAGPPTHRHAPQDNTREWWRSRMHALWAIENNTTAILAL
jgi:hypothetical protein